VWQTWAYSLVFVLLACWHTDVSRWSGGQPWRLSPFHRRKHCWCAHTSLPANFQCSHRVVLVPFCIIYNLHLIAVWFLHAIWLPEWSLQLPSFLAFYVSKGRAGRSNTSLRTLCFHSAVTWSLPSTCHVQGDWSLLCLSPHTWFQEFSVINPSVLLQYLHDGLIRCLISLLVTAVLFVITFTPFFISSPECNYLSPSTCKLLFMFWHLILCCPSSYCITHAIMKCRMTILICYFPCLAARVFPREDCSILAPLFAYLRIWNSLIWQNVGPSFTIFPRCSFTLTKKVAVCVPRTRSCHEKIIKLVHAEITYIYAARWRTGMIDELCCIDV